MAITLVFYQHTPFSAFYLDHLYINSTLLYKHNFYRIDIHFSISITSLPQLTQRLMTKTLNQCYIVLVIGCLAIHAYSQCPTFYADINLQGNTFGLCSSGNVPGQYNDQVSSFTVPSGYSVTLYQNANYGGQSFGPYRQGIYNVPGQFNDQLSSVRISKSP